MISFSDWEKIDQYEIAEGQKKGKPREKIVEHSKFLDVALHSWYRKLTLEIILA